MTHEKAYLTPKEARVAQLLADDDLTDEAIAQDVGLARATIARWKQREDIQTRIAHVREEIAARILSTGIARRENRVRALHDRWERMIHVIEQRADSPETDAAPGGDTGLIVHQIKVVGQGSAAQTVDEYVVDVGLLRELRAHEQQAAQEVGQWTEKRDISVSGPLKVTLKIDRRASDDDRDGD